MSGGTAAFEKRPDPLYKERRHSMDSMVRPQFFTLKNDRLELRLTNVGAAMTRLRFTAEDGRTSDLIAGLEKPEDYLHNVDFLGALVGRWANRIAPAEFIWDGETVRLAADADGIHLHGGPDTLSLALWETEAQDDTSIRFTILSPDGASGYPGNARFTVTYTLDGRRIIAELGAESDKKTPVNLTLHPYWNLEGAPVNVRGHILHLAAASYTLVDVEDLLTGRRYDCKNNTGRGFFKPRPLGDHPYDTNFVLSPSEEPYQACISSPASGLCLKISCTQPCMQLYTADGLSTVGRDGIFWPPHSAFCLEPQYMINAVNLPGETVPFAAPGKPYRERIVYELQG